MHNVNIVERSQGINSTLPSHKGHSKKSAVNPWEKDLLIASEEGSSYLISSSNHIELPKKSTAVEPAYLRMLAKAMERAYEVLAQGTITLTKDLANLQQLSETMSTIINKQTNEQIAQELKQVQIIKNIEADQKKSDLLSRITRDISTFGISEILTAAGVSTSLQDRIMSDVSTLGLSEAINASGLDPTTKMVLTIGVSLAVGLALFIATAGVGTGATAAAEAGEAANAANTAARAEQGVGEGMEMVNLGSRAAEGAAQVEEGATSSTETATSVSLSVARETESATQEVKPAINQKLSKILYALCRAAVGGAFGAMEGIPEILQGVASFEIADAKEDLADNQRKVGQAMAVVQINNNYFKLYQRILQRQTDAAVEAGNELGEVNQTFAQIVSSYNQIATNLAQQRV